MADIVKLQLQFAERQPVKTGGSFQVQEWDSLPDFLLANRQIREQFCFGVRLSEPGCVVWGHGQPPDELGFRAVFAPGHKILFGVLQVQVGVKEGVVSNVPEFRFVIGAVPERFGAFLDGLFVHFERSQVLGSDDFWKVHESLLSLGLDETG